MESMRHTLMLIFLFGSTCGHIEDVLRTGNTETGLDEGKCEMLNRKTIELEHAINIMAGNQKSYDGIISKLQHEIDQLKESSNNEINSLQNELAAVNELLAAEYKDVNSTPKNHEKRMLLPDVPNVGAIAFTAAMASHHENLGIHQIVRFDRVVTNVGSGFDSVSSIFKAPVSGNYFFTVIIMSHATEDIETQIVKNGVPLVNTYSGDSTTWNQGSQSVVVALNVGDDVYVHIMDNKGVNDGNVRVFGGLWSSFSGFLISK